MDLRKFPIQLIHPPGLVNARSLATLTPCLPLGLAYIASSLEAAGFPVNILDAVGEAPEKVEIEGQYLRLGLGIPEILARLEPDTKAVGISVTFSFLWPFVRSLIQEIRQHRPGIFIIGGGEHFTALTEHSMKEAPLDFIVRGEGEETAAALMLALAEDKKDFSGIPGIAWRENGTIRINPPRPRIRKVDDIPPPAWHLLNLNAYHQAGWVNGLRKGRTLPILATRGCPYECTYCASPGMWTRLWTARDPIRVVDEIENAVRRYGASNFPFHDLTAIIRKDWIVTFCREIIRRNLDIVWQFPSGTRCEAIDEEVAGLLLRSGGRHLCFAPESGSEETRIRIKKKMTEPALLRSVRAAVRHRLNITVLLVLGFPQDTWQDLMETARLVRRLAIEGVDDLGIGFFFPLPNTELTRYLEAKGRVHLNDDFLMLPLGAIEMTFREANNYCENLSAFQLSLAKIWVLMNFYPVSFFLRPLRLLRLIRNIFSSREESKLESFLQEWKRRMRIALKKSSGIPRI